MNERIKFRIWNEEEEARDSFKLRFYNFFFQTPIKTLLKLAETKGTE